MKIIFYWSVILLFLLSLNPLCLGNTNERILLSEAENLIGLKPLQETANDEVWSIIGAQVFSYQDEIKATGSSYLVKDRKVTKLGSGFGGFGIASMCVSDLNKNRKPELLYLYHFGSGVNYTIPGCYEDGKIISVSFYSRYHYDLSLKKIDLSKIQIVTRWHEKIEFDKNKKTYSMVGQKEITIGDLFFAGNILRLNLYDGIPVDITRNIIKSIFGMPPS